MPLQTEKEGFCPDTVTEKQREKIYRPYRPEKGGSICETYWKRDVFTGKM